MSTFLSDIRYAFRQLARAPGFTLPVVVCLALGVGVNAAVFSVFNSVLLRPFPYKDPEQLAAVFETNVKRGATRSTVCPADFLDWRDQTGAFESIAAYRAWEPSLTGTSSPERLPGIRATGALLRMLGVAPAAGRVFLGEDEQRRARVVVLSHALWQRVLRSDPAIVGRSVRLDDQDYEVIGVMPADFQFPTREADLWAPLSLDPSRQDRGEHSLHVVGRLRRGTAWESARAELGAMMKRIESQNDGCGADLVSLRDWYVGPASRRTLWILLAAVALVVLIASVNVANLQLALGTARQLEFAVRSAIGASRGRLLMQLLTENIVLAVLSAWLGLILALWSRNALVYLLPPGSVYRLLPAVLDWRCCDRHPSIGESAGRREPGRRPHLRWGCGLLAAGCDRRELSASAAHRSSGSLRGVAARVRATR